MSKDVFLHMPIEIIIKLTMIKLFFKFFIGTHFKNSVVMPDLRIYTEIWLKIQKC